MNILKWIGLALMALVLLLLAAALLLPKDVTVERSVDIKAPAAVVFAQVSNYQKWNAWSPWYEMDTLVKNEYFGDAGKVGSGFSWVGEKSGEGKMTTMSQKDNEEIDYQLNFIKPFVAAPTGSFKFKEENGVTTATWSMTSHYSIPKNIMGAMMKGEIGKSFAHGLDKLKAVAEKEAANPTAAAKTYDIQEVAFEAKEYVSIRKVTSIKELGAYFQKVMPTVFVEGMKNKLEQAGAPTGLYYSWDLANDKTDLAIAVPVKKAKELGGEYSVQKIATSKALMVDYYGSYDKIGAAHDALQKYMADKGLKQLYPVIEEYVGDPGDGKDWSKVLTKVYYLIE